MAVGAVAALVIVNKNLCTRSGTKRRWVAAREDGGAGEGRQSVARSALERSGALARK